MKKLLYILLLVIVTSLGHSASVQAQCAMCTISAEQGVKNGNTQSKGLNTGVLYLMAIPYLLIGSLGALWYFKFRKKTTADLRHD